MKSRILITVIAIVFHIPQVLAAPILTNSNQTATNSNQAANFWDANNNKGSSVWDLPGREYKIAQSVENIRLIEKRMGLDNPLSCPKLAGIITWFFGMHIHQKEMTPEMELDVIRRFIQGLDTPKHYFLKDDIKQNEKVMTNFLHYLKTPDCRRIAAPYKLLVTRMEQILLFTREYLKADADFKLDKDVIESTHPNEREYFNTIKEVEDFHRRLIHVRMARLLKRHLKTGQEQEIDDIDPAKIKVAKARILQSYEDDFKVAQNNLQPDGKHQIWDWFMGAFASSLDPNSFYLTPDAVREMAIEDKGTFEGVGAEIMSKDGYITIRKILPGGALDKSEKVQPNDKFVEIGDDTTGPMERVVNMDLSKVANKLRGVAGSKVRVKFLREHLDGTSEYFQLTLTRSRIRVESKWARMYYIEREVNGQKKLIGVLELPVFYGTYPYTTKYTTKAQSKDKKKWRSAYEDMKQLLAEARAKKVDGVVLDLSKNGGGLVQEATLVAGLFIKAGHIFKSVGTYQPGYHPLFQTKKINSVMYTDLDDDVDFPGPLVICVSRRTASASEIVAGTLKDYKRAIIVGADHTYGKGTVQSRQTLPQELGGAINVTSAMYFTVSGNPTQQDGVLSDIVFPTPFSTDKYGIKYKEGSLLPPQKVGSFLSEEAYVTEGPEAWRPLNEAVLNVLKNKARKRIENNEYFNNILKENLAKSDEQSHQPKRVSDILRPAVEQESGSPDTNNLINVGGSDRESQEEKYLNQPEVQEAINVVVDYITLIEEFENPKVGL